jgi:hypothetical protein
MNALLVYLILNAAGKWEFLTVERVPNRTYCEVLQADVARAYQGKRGNFRIVCTDNLGVET